MPDEVKTEESPKKYVLENIQQRKEEDARKINELLPQISSMTQEQIARKIIAESRKNERSQKKAERDPLTGLLNRRGFDERFVYEIERSKRADQPLGFVSFDLDHFKTINDEIGHDAGDEVLAELGKVFRAEGEEKIVRTVDTPGRIGGEEFAVLIPEVREEENLKSIAERMKQILEQRLSLIDKTVEKNIKVTSSFGVSLYSPHEKSETTEEAIKRVKKEADIALYQAKKQGRNRVVVYSPDMR